ncbi:hypothetical protein ACJJTC_008516 [Scirpophaga incertulas]
MWVKEGQKIVADVESVQGRIELGLLKLKSLIYPRIVLSSRTDGGVHALSTVAHFDLERYGTNFFDPHYITYALNKFFFETESSIYVKNCLRTADNFNARFHAISRTYLYRFAVLKPNINLPENESIASYIPIEEWKRCYFTRLQNFDIEKFKEGAKYFVGYHDFTTFRRFDKQKQHKHNRRQITAIEVRPGAPLITSYSHANYSSQSPLYNRHYDVFNYWEIQFKGRGYVHNQIRRMVATLLSVAVGKLPVEEIKVMLQIPSKHSWHSCIQTCPSDGLYLCEVEYNPEDVIYKSETSEVEVNE